MTASACWIRRASACWKQRRAWSRKNCRNCTRNFSRTSGSVASSPVCMTANPAVPSRRRCRRGRLTETGWRDIGNCWRMSGWRGRIGISDIKANKITPACEPMAVQFTCWGDFFAIFNYCCSVSRLICLSKSELIRWVRLNTSYSAKAFCCACA